MQTLRARVQLPEGKYVWGECTWLKQRRLVVAEGLAEGLVATLC